MPSGTEAKMENTVTKYITGHFSQYITTKLFLPLFNNSISPFQQIEKAKLTFCVIHPPQHDHDVPFLITFSWIYFIH